MAKKVEVDISVLPERYLKVTQAWMDAYMEAADVEKLIAYQKKLLEYEKPSFNDRRKVFVEVFEIKFPKKKKEPEQKHMDFLAELIKKKQGEAK